MAKAFLDTHVMLWLARGDKRITPSILKAINASTETLISSMSVAELEVKAAKGKIALAKDWVKSLEDAGIKVAPFSSENAQALSRFPALANHDPFDRMILAHAASTLGATLFTADEVLASQKLDWVIDCR